jgi:diguanylate cyclase (GGDEF)-like protein/PAS domain S-box-containing protein
MQSTMAEARPIARLHPLGARARHAGPLAMGIAALTLAGASDARHPGAVVALAAAFVVLSGIAGIFVPLDRGAGIVKALPPAIAIAGYALLASATGGAHSDYLPMTVVPMLWFGLEGTDRQIAGGITAFCLSVFLPWTAFGAPKYPLAEWDQAALGLVAGIGLALILRKLARERAAVEADLARAARHDALTGLLNRTAWSELAEHELARAARSGQPLAVASFDLDAFKELNDSGGHQAGDRALVAVGAALTKALRATDVVSRTGGDEFLVLLPECDPETAARVAERARAAMPGRLGCSAGLAIWDGHESLESLVARADSGLYAAKASGRGRLAVGSTHTIAAGVHRASSGIAVARASDMRIDDPGGGSFNELLDNAGVLLGTADGGTFISVNAAFEGVLGWWPEEMLAGSLADQIHPDDLEATSFMASEVARGERRLIGFECRMRHRDGGYRLIRWHARADGRIWRLVGQEVGVTADAGGSAVA